MSPLGQHQIEIQRNRKAWESKPLLRDIYGHFYESIKQLIDPSCMGAIVEIGSGIGNLREHVKGAICSDLFPNPWLDVVCDGYKLPFKQGSVSHLVLFDVFHHLQMPAAFLAEARRVLIRGGRVIIFEPYISLSSLFVYGLLHHEPVAWSAPINLSLTPPVVQEYYAGQGNATRIFFRNEIPGFPGGWRVFSKSAFSSFSYVLSGGYSKPAFYPSRLFPMIKRLDATLSRWPVLFGSRCLIGLKPE
jgi:hypothetical protein